MEQYLIYILPALFSIFLLLQLYYLLFVYRKLKVYKIKGLKEDSEYPPLSVIVCARNEESNLRMYLSEILEQEYPLYEVIVVNDCSSDDSNWVLKEFKQRYKHLRTIDISENVHTRHGKKFAVTLGVKGASHEHLILTDADCYPQSNQWLKYMAQEFKGDVEIVLGYSPYTRLKGLLNKYIRYETFQTAINYLGYALKRNAYMGVGRNLAYTKKLFFKGRGFATHMHIPSGDDDLFVNQNATRSNVAICIHPDAMVWSNPKSTYRAYLRQKKRHFGAGSAYRSKHKFMLSMQALGFIFFYLSAILVLILQPYFWPIVAVGYVARSLLQAIIYIPLMKKLHVRELIIWLPALEIFHFLYISYMGFTSLFRKNVHWK